jgi:DNA polymerase-3 subunit gamma/tau
MTDSPPAYRVLARAYRPQTFSALLGQEAMVQTLANAIRRDRIAHAFIMTGVRGVGKTSTARLLAKALNCVGPDGQGGPTIDPCGVCEPCQAIAEGRHIDIIEMDAASHTGIDDVREITEACRYAAVSARFKMYIIDEAHMLSRQAWNGLLKTLEEPPAHVKFIFATTEVNKVPVTVLSRCQRFDLRRIPAETLHTLFAEIALKERVTADGDALAMIAGAAEGSARDGLSILDQAIAHAEAGGAGEQPHVTADQVRVMLGLADKGAVRALLDHVLAGNAPAMLGSLAEQDALGVEPAATINGLLELVHTVTLAKTSRSSGGAAQPEAERAAVDRWAAELSFPVLHRLWQMLLKGHEEIAKAARPAQACQMALLRLVHAASLPDPGELARLLGQGGGLPASAPHASSPAPAPTQSPALSSASAPAPQVNVPDAPADFAALVDQVSRVDAKTGSDLRLYVGLVRYDPPHLDLKPLQPLDAAFVSQLVGVLKRISDIRWAVQLKDGPSAPSLAEQAVAADREAAESLASQPIVQAAMVAFPDARLLRPGTDEVWSYKS